MKTISLLMLLPLHVVAQDLTGVWTGYLQTGDEKLPYELVISGVKDKLSGYSLMTFTFNGVENVGVKTMELKVKRGKIAVEDGDLIYDNYNTPPQKVKLYASLAWVGRDTNMILAGTFATRSLDMRTSIRANSFKGVIHLEKKNVRAQTKLTSKLSEMDLMNRLSFTQPVKKEEQKVTEGHAKQKAAKTKVKDQPAQNNAEATTLSHEKETKIIKTTPAVPAVDLVKRNTEILQTVLFKSDSVRITLYDNGEVDGDTVTVVLNGQTIISRLRLTDKGISQSIATSELADSSQLIMYAENLGRIPPNTGLLILQDGNERYQIRFSGDLQNNSAIMLKRKK